MRKIFFVTIAFMLVLPSIGWAQAQQAPAEILSPQDCEKNGFKDCVYGIKWGTQVNKDFMEQNYCPKVPAGDILDFKKNKQRGNRDADFGRWSPGQPVCQVGEVITNTTTDRYRYVGSTQNVPPLFYLLKNFLNYQNIDLVHQAISMASGREVDENFIPNYYPVVLGKITRSLIVFPTQLVGYTTTSEVTDGIDPKIYFLEAKKKYGEPIKVHLDDPNDAPYSIIGAWEEDNKKLLVGIAFELDQQKIAQARNGRKDGAVIQGLVSGLPGEKAGLRPGDVLVGSNNTPVVDAASFIELIKKQAPESVLNLKIIRAGKEFVAKTKLAPNPYYRENPSPLTRFILIQPKNPDDPNSKAYVKTVLLHKGFPSIWAAVVKQSTGIIQAQQNKEHEEKKKELNNVDL